MEFRKRDFLKVLSRSILAIAMLSGSASANEDVIHLLCDYDSEFSSKNHSNEFVPREIIIEQEKSMVSWNGIVKDVPASLSDLEIEFSYKGFNYWISRVSGNIRLSNPEILRNVENWRREALSLAIKAGHSPKEAERMIDAQLEGEYTAKELSGTCLPAGKRKF
jgi:hypothetical protein